MFTGFTDETVQFFLDLKFHNNAGFFHTNHDRYVECVQRPFYELINDLAPVMASIDPRMETRPHKCLSRIHRDTRFSRDKSPYRDHHWFLFRRAGEPREKSLFYFFEFGPERLNWGMGVWGENRELFDQFRRKLSADPDGISGLIGGLGLGVRHLSPGGTFYKRMEIPSSVPEHMKQWYTVREMYVGKTAPAYRSAFSARIVPEIRKDFLCLAPLYRLLRGCQDDVQAEKTEYEGKDDR